MNVLSLSAFLIGGNRKNKPRRNEGFFIGLAKVIMAFKAKEQFVEQHQARVFITKGLEQQYLACGYIIVPFDLIDYGDCLDNTVTVYLKEDDHFLFKKISFEMPSIKEVATLVDNVKLQPKPDEPDENVTSLSADSDSRRSDTKGVDNLLESDEPPPTEDH